MQINAVLQPMLLTGQTQQINGQQRDNTGFGDILGDALAKVNQAQLNANQMKLKFVTGEVEDVHQVTIAAEEAKIAISLAVEVRNKMVEAYQEISRMAL
ncbi:flagellar hook-basal body complex protein FliE [Peptococcaceae bacterium 1198_IL3148]